MPGTRKLCQLYDEQGRPIPNDGYDMNSVLSQAILHGAAHVWLWRKADEGVEVLLQQRAKDKPTWPGRWDISAAGHIDDGEEPLQAALRETKEEIGIDLDEQDLELLGINKSYTEIPGSLGVENEYQWLYLVRVDEDLDFNLEDSEVSELAWMNFEQFRRDVESEDDRYTPHNQAYYAMLLNAIMSKGNN